MKGARAAAVGDGSADDLLSAGHELGTKVFVGRCRLKASKKLNKCAHLEGIAFDWTALLSRVRPVAHPSFPSVSAEFRDQGRHWVQTDAIVGRSTNFA